LAGKEVTETRRSQRQRNDKGHNSTLLKKENKMSKTHTMALLIGCGVIIVSAGCASDTARINYDNRIKTAFGQLQKGESSQALDSLQMAREVGQENGYDQAELNRLSVEVNLGSGNLAEAHRQANELLTADPKDAYANELMGKVFLKDGQYSEAQKYFVKAQEIYESEVDISRASDLVALSRYFNAYEGGNPRLAERYLREIQNPDLQHVVDKAQKDIMAKGH